MVTRRGGEWRDWHATQASVGWGARRCWLVPSYTDEETVWWLAAAAVLHLEGEVCRRLRNGEVQFIDVVVGCPGWL